MVFMKLKLIKQHCSFLTLSLIFSVATANDLFNFDSIDLSEPTESTTSPSKAISNDDFDDLINGITPEELATIRSCPLGNANNWLLAFAQLDFIPALNAPFYKATSIPITRNLIHYPAMEICSYPDLSNRQFTGHILFTQTSQKAFRTSTDDEVGTRIGSYLNIEDRTLINVLEKFFSTNKQKATVDFTALNRALGSAHLEERRFAFMSHYYQEMGNDFYFEAKMPLIWMIRNLNFKQQYKDVIDQQLSIYKSGGGNVGDGKFDENAFADKHLIMDVLGTGTVELSLCKKVWEHSNWSVDLGGGLLLPTDYAFACGIRGSCFKPIEKAPVLNFCDIIDLSTQTVLPGGAQIASDYFLGALDQLSSILLQCPLGYNNHLGVELKLSPFWQVKPNLEFNGIYIFEAFLPREQQRFFVPKNTKESFADQYAALPQSTEEEQQAKLAFVEQRITQLLYPKAITTKMYPGWIFTSISSLRRAYRGWDFIAGYSGWYKSGEKILSFPNNSASEMKALNLNYAKSVNPEVYSVKLFGKIHRTLHTKRHDDLSLSLWADATIFNSGIGNDFSLGMCFDHKF